MRRPFDPPPLQVRGLSYQCELTFHFDISIGPTKKLTLTSSAPSNGPWQCSSVFNRRCLPIFVFSGPISIRYDCTYLYMTRNATYLMHRATGKDFSVQRSRSPPAISCCRPQSNTLRCFMLFSHLGAKMHKLRAS